ncbi:MAG: hypothetical protein ABFR75_12670 [Acidobacteriota bacterium]
MKNNILVQISKRLPLLIGISMLWLFIFIPLNSSLDLNDGNLIYTLDDTYIHMAIAKHMAEDGVFGVTKYEFTPSSSSPLWTLLLSFFFFIFGVNEFTPFLLNLFFASALIVVLFYFLEKQDFSLILKILILLSFVFFIPLPYLVLTGLEHVLQILLSLLLIFGIINVIDKKPGEKNSFTKLPFFTYIVSFLLVSIRYEGLFLIGSIALFLIIKRKFNLSFLLLLSGSLPVIIYGIISKLNGWYFIPNAILLKGNRVDLFSINSILLFLYNGLRQIIYNIHILVLLILVVFLLFIVIKKYGEIFSRYTLAGYIFIVVTVLHMFFARSGLFLSINFQIRYDSYLIVLGLISILYMPLSEWFGSVKQEGGGRIILYILIFLTLLPLSERSLKTMLKTSQASSNTYSNQYMLGKFVNKYYKGEKLLLNDIGGINFLTDIKCLDILGLSSKEPAELILKGNFNRSTIEKAGKSFDANIAIVNEQLIKSYGGIPESWILVGQWRLNRGVISSLNTISFYALENGEIEKLSESLKEFSGTLPESLSFRILK